MRVVNLDAQGFEELRTHNDFYIDKTSFIREWWGNRDKVTLIERPRRFGKTLNMDMLNCFFSNRYAGRSGLFEGLDIWKDERYRELQGTWPTIFLSFSEVRAANYRDARDAFIGLLTDLFQSYMDLWERGTARRKKDDIAS